MNSPSGKWLLVSLLLTAVAVSSLRSATPVIGEQFFQDTNARIEDLFQYRKNPPKPPGPLDNPFRVGDAPLASSLNLSGNSAGGTGPGPIANSDEALLRQAAGSLVFGGLIQLGEVQVLVINKANYKEGGILSVRLQGTLVYLRIVSITSNSVMLGLNEARLTLHF
jgi:hypothetical protein